MGLRRIYCKLLQLYPPDYRALFAAEMAAAFDEAVIDRRRRPTGLIAFMFAELTGLVMGACREWIARLAYSLSHSNGYIDGRGLPDPLLMRPAGIAWETHYGWGATRVAAAGRAAAGARHNVGPCLNAQQTFALASPFRRLAILICGCARCCSGCY